MKLIRFSLATLLLIGIPVLEEASATQIEQQTPGDSRSVDSSSEDEHTSNPVRPGQIIELRLAFGNVFESNIEHDKSGLPSHGTVPSLHLKIRNRRRKPTIVFGYVVANHSYTNSTRFDRISHLGNLLFLHKWSGTLRTETKTELSLGGSSEDRDVSNQFLLDQDIEFRFSRAHRFHIYGTLRWKRISGRSDQDAFKPRIGFVHEIRSSTSSRRFEVGGRFELNRKKLIRGDYNRITLETAYRFPLFTPDLTIKLSVKGRQKMYLNRTVKTGTAETSRTDYRLIAGISVVASITRQIELNVGYQNESRSSNDIRKDFDARAFSFTVDYQVW